MKLFFTKFSTLLFVINGILFLFTLIPLFLPSLGQKESMDRIINFFKNILIYSVIANVIVFLFK